MDPSSSPLDPASPDLSIEPVIGWRLWKLARGADGRLALLSPLQAYTWSPMEPNRARCPAGRGHRPPGVGCTCGLYAAARLRELPRTAAGQPGAVLGSVALWGQVIEHAAGYRAEVGYPDRLRLVCGPCFHAGRTGVPISVGSLGGALVPVCEAHALAPGVGRIELDPAALERELLSTYAVDLLPIELVHEAGFRSDPPSPHRAFTDEARDELRQLRSSRLGWLYAAALVVAFLVLRSLGILTSPAIPEPVAGKAETGGITAVSPSPITLDLGSVDPPDATGARVEPSPEPRGRPRAAPAFPSFAFACGHLEGTTVQLRPCRASDADLLAIASWPPKSRSECDPGHGYTRERRFSLCWLSSVGPVGPPGRELGTWHLRDATWRDLPWA